MSLHRAFDEVLAMLFPKEGDRAAIEDVTMGEEPIGMGFPGEQFDIRCAECSGTMRLRPSKHGLFYGCENYPTCSCALGAHPNGAPKGIPGDASTRRARKLAHRIFDRLWREEEGHKPRMTRAQAYAWMRRTLKLTEDEAHIAKFQTELCETLIAAVKKKYPGVMNVWDRVTLDDDD